MNEAPHPELDLTATAEAELRDSLARRFHRDASVGAIGHPVVAAVIALLVRPEIGDGGALLLFALIAGATVLRVAVHRSAPPAPVDDRGLVLRTRASTALVALGWAAVSLIFFPSIGAESLGRILMAYAGLVAAGVATHQSDRAGFHLFSGLLLGSAVVGSILSGRPLAAIDTTFILAFWAMMSLLHARLHRQLRVRLRTGLQLQAAIGRATREKEFVDAVLAGAPDGMAVLSPDGRIARVSTEFERIVGQPRTDLLDLDPGDKPEHLFWKSLADVAAEARRRGRAASDAEMRENATARWFRLSAAVGQGAATGWVVVLVEDRTALRAAQAAREAAEASYYDLVESAHDLIWKVDLAGDWTFLNSAATGIYGLPPIDLLGTGALERALPEHAEADEHAFRALLEGREIVDHETVHRTAHGGERVLSFSARPLYDDSGAIVGAQGVARDVTDRKLAAERMAAMAEEADRATRMKSAFLANMSHEIRTPMNGVLGMTEILLDTSLSEEQRQYLEIVQSSGQSLLRILNDVLDFSKIEAGHVELEEIPFPLHRDLGDAVRVLAPVAAQRSNELILDIEPAVPEWVVGDPGRLRQVVTNLVSNAIKFTEGGEVQIVVRRRSGEQLWIEVRDTGVGIPEDKLDTVFREFSQADSSITRRYGGTGLGLTITRRLVELMGGRIDVESREGSGSTFGIDIPLHESDPTEEFETAGVDADLTDLRILVVDDNPTNRKIITSALQEAGARVAGAAGARAGLATLDRWADAGNAASLVVTDVQMPEIDGIRFLEHIRRGRHARVPVVVLTSTNDPADARRARALGVQGYHLKPLPRADLVEAASRAARADVDAPDLDLFDRESDAQTAEVTAREEPLHGASADFASPGATPRPDASPCHILVAEDNPVNREVAAATLRQAGFTIEMVENGAQAVAAVRERDFDLVLMDVQMPVLDGVEATRRIRGSGRGSDVPILALTAHAQSEERMRCLDAGMSDFLSKPFRPAELIERIRALIRTEHPSTPAVSEDGEGSVSAIVRTDVPVAPKPAGTLPSASVGSAPVNLESLQASMDRAGIGEIVETMLELFLDEIDTRREALVRSLAKMEHSGIADTAHALKSSSGNIHAVRLFEGLQKLERAGREEHEADVTRLGPEVLGEIDRVTAFLRSR